MPRITFLHRFSLQSLMLFVTLVCVVAGWIIDRSRPAEILYLHLYSTRYDDHRLWGHQNQPRKNECFATVAISPGIEFYADVPNYYYPEFQVHGTVTKRSNSFSGAFTIFAADPGTAISHDQTASGSLDILIPFGPDDREFHFAISHSSDPYSLDYKLR
jgi:hypothetical protein